MTFEEAVHLLMGRFGNIPRLKARIEGEMRFVHKEVLEKDPQIRPWFLLPSSPQNFVLTANQHDTALPSGFLGEYEYGSFFYPSTVSSNFPFLQMTKQDYEVLFARFGDQTGSEEVPTHYAIVGKTFHAFPIPTAAVTLKSFFYTETAALRNDASNIWLTDAADWLIAESGLRLAMYHTKDSEMQALFAADVQRAKDRIEGENVERERVNVNAMMSDI